MTNADPKLMFPTDVGPGCPTPRLSPNTFAHPNTRGSVGARYRKGPHSNIFPIDPPVVPPQKGPDPPGTHPQSHRSGCRRDDWRSRVFLGTRDHLFPAKVPSSDIGCRTRCAANPLRVRRSAAEARAPLRRGCRGFSRAVLKRRLISWSLAQVETDARRAG